MGVAAIPWCSQRWYGNIGYWSFAQLYSVDILDSSFDIPGANHSLSFCDSRARRVGPGSFTPSLSQNRTWQSPVIRLFQTNLPSKSISPMNTPSISPWAYPVWSGIAPNFLYGSQYRQHIFQILCVAALSQAIGQMPHSGRDLLKADWELHVHSR